MPADDTSEAGATKARRESRPPSVDALARSLASTGLPHPLLVDVARRAIANGDHHQAERMALTLRASLLRPVVNATGVIAHTNLGRSPVEIHQTARAQNLEFDLSTGQRGSRQTGAGALIARAVGAESAMVVNNNAAAVLLVLAALASGRDVAVSRGESVEIGGSFRVPEVMEQSGARLVDVGTTNRTRVGDYRKAIERKNNDVALVLKVHPSNYRVEGFVEETSVRELATLGVDVVADIGSGLLDEACPWLDSGPPAWLRGEPAARQTIEAGASLVTFSADKLLGGPQAGIIAGRADLVARCASHPLARALRPGGLVLAALHDVMTSYLERTVTSRVPFWRMATVSVDTLRDRAHVIVSSAGTGVVIDCDSLPGAGSTPGAHIPSCGIALDGDVSDVLRDRDVPVVARVREGRTILDLRTVAPDDDRELVAALSSLTTPPSQSASPDT
jgi:L-seryl-tRNA(Ser) seleniumtransferase